MRRRVGAPEQQVGDVRASDEQHDADDGHQDHRQPNDRRAGLALRIQSRVEQRYRAGASSLVVDWKRLLETGEDGLQLRRRLVDGDARLQPSESKRNRPRRCSYQSKFGCATACIDIGTQADGLPPRMVPVKPCCATPTTVKAVRLSVSVFPTMFASRPRLRSQNPWLSTTTGVGLDDLPPGRKRPAERGLRAEHREVVAADDLQRNLLGLGAGAPVHLGEGERRHLGEDLVLVAQVLVIEMRERQVAGISLVGHEDRRQADPLRAQGSA